MNNNRKFRAVQGIGLAGIFGAVLILVAEDASSQTALDANVPSAATTEETPPENRVVLKFFNADWTTVLNKVAEQSGSTAVMHEVPPGLYNRRDKTPYTRHEAVQILNHELEPEGFRILEKDKFLIVVHQRALRTRYRRPETPSQPEWQPDPVKKGQFEPAPKLKRSVTPIATRETQPPAQIQLAGDTKPIPAPVPAVMPEAPLVPATQNPTTNPIAMQDAPSAPAELPAGWSFTTLSPRNNVRDLAGSLYKALQDRAELIDAGVTGLPAFRVQFASPVQSAGIEGFEVGIDIPKNQIVMAANPERLRQLANLFQYIDRENNAFEQPIRLVAADENTAHIAQELTPQLKRLAREVERLNAPPMAPQVGNHPAENLEREWALAQAQPNPQQPATAQQPPQGTQVLPVQPGTPGGISAVVANFKGDVQIQAIPELGIMILKGNQADVDALMKIIAQIQEQTKGVLPQIDVLFLENLSSESFAELIRTIYEQLGTITTRTGTPRQQASFIPLSRPNAVIIVAPQVEMANIKDLAKKLDQPIDPLTTLEVFPLKHAIASQAAAILTSSFTTQAAPGTAAAATATALQPRVRVFADVRTNSLIVQARPNDLKEAALIISKIDVPGPGSVSKMQVIPLKNAVADELANVISSAIQSLLNPPSVVGTPPQGQVTNQGGGAGQGPQEFRDVKAVALDFLSSIGGLEKTVRSGILSDIRVTPDLRSNSLVVTAPEQSMEMMIALIQQLDQPTSTVAEIKIFVLENADAGSMITLLEALFQPDPNATQQGVQIAGAEDASSGLIPLRFSVDVRTNAIIAIGGGDALVVVEAILLKLDASDVRQRQTTVVKLRNSPATEVAAAINTFLQAQRDLATIDPELVSNTELLEREIIAVAEPVSNSLLISTTPRYAQEIQKLIQQLDAEPPQVVIQALLVEVALDNTDEFGMELGFQDDILFDRSLTTATDITTIDVTNTSPNGVATTTQQIISQATTPGFRFNEPAFAVPLGNNQAAAPGVVGSQSLSNFSLGRINNDLGFGGLVLSASSNQVSVLLRALAARRQVHILSRPQIRTLDNQVAQIQVGQQVPIVNGITFGGANNAAYPIVVQDSAGIILTVTPRISPEENIVMEVVAEKSAFTGAGVTIFVDSTTGNEITSPIKDLTTARTTVGVPNGQTIVLGGMITKNDETIERKVPWLGDLPYLGLPFRYDSTRTRRTELLIFLTPRIIRCAADAELIKQVEWERLHAVEQDAEEIHGPLFAIPGEPGMSEWMGGPEFCPMDIQEAPVQPGTMMPPNQNRIPVPSPGIPPATPYGPAIPPDAANGQMGWRSEDSRVPAAVVPAGGFPQNSKKPQPQGGTRPQGQQQAPAPKKRPWYSWGK